MENNKQEKVKIKSFTDLVAWQKAHELAIEIYKITDKFPAKENFGLTSQMRRSGISISSNIAEGFKRFTAKDKYQFYSISHGSLTELQNQLLLSRDIGYINNEEFNKVADKTVIVSRLITGLKRIKKS